MFGRQMIRDLFNQQDIFIGLYIVYMYLKLDHSMYEYTYVIMYVYLDIQLKHVI